MIIKRILVQLPQHANKCKHINVAKHLAERFDARLFAFTVRSNPTVAPPANDVSNLFVAKETIPNNINELINLTLLHDLLIVSGDFSLSESRVKPRNVPVLQIANQVACPTLIVPHQQDCPLSFKRPVIAWDASREASRTLRAAWPFLDTSEPAIFSSPLAHHRMTPGLRSSSLAMRDYLKAHGVNAALAAQPNEQEDPAISLLNFVTSHERDFIIVGSYGHTQVRELLLGHTGRLLLQNTNLPLLVFN